MNQNVEMPGIFGKPRFQRWLERPRLMKACMPAEIIPQGLVSLELKLSGWGWAKCEGTGRSEPRRWFWHDRDMLLFVPVGSHVTVTLINLWGSKRYEIDATSGRKEVWVPPNERFQFSLSCSASMNLPEAPSALPTCHWHVQIPMCHKITLPDPPKSLNLPSLKFDDWRTTSPMDDLERRLKRAAISD